MAFLELRQTRAALADSAAQGWDIGSQLAVWRDGAPLISHAEGVARPGVAMTDASLIPWFSMTKIVTAVAVGQLWERAALSLDEPVATYIDGFSAGGKAPVTIRHVLTHTGGFRYLAGSEQLYAGGLDYDALLRAVSAAPLEPGWVPGGRAGYHPATAFHVLGEIVRIVDGRAFDAYASEEVFEPLGMADSWIAMTPERVAAYGERMVQMVDTTGPEPAVLPRLLEPNGWSWVLPSGSGVGPAADLVRLLEALRQGGVLEGQRILADTTTSSIVARHREGMADETFGWIIDWGLGLMVNSWHYRDRAAPYGYGDHAGRDAFGHGGMQSSLAFADPAHGLSVVVAFNGMPGEAANHRRTQRVVNALYADLALVTGE
ncbi:MAG TPA: serine hydrolase domain-containing protein [Acidimicrobiales bacterium]|nr:serine hydrolase domain-containing protein [Acidimicrobiales bacterium]